MKLSAKSRYAVMAMVDMACHAKEGPVNLKQISSRQSIAVNYLEQIFVSLRRAGLVTAVKGPGGGYLLAKDINDISVADVMLAVNKEFKITRCGSGKDHPGCMYDNVKCATHHLWSDLGKVIITNLKSKSLAQVINSKRGLAYKDE